jgi:hypothetical protein
MMEIALIMCTILNKRNSIKWSVATSCHARDPDSLVQGAKASYHVGIVEPVPGE